MQLQLGVLVLGQNGEGRVARAGSYFEEGAGTVSLGGDLVQDGELLLKPLAILEEVGGVVLVELVPPLCRVRVEPICFLDKLADCSKGLNV